MPPLLPVQLQVPADALYPEAVPAVQVSAVLLQAPLTALVLLHEAVVPPLLPAQLHVVVVPLLVVPDATPAVQTPTVALQAPLRGSALLHEAFAPPLLPAQVHVVVTPLFTRPCAVPGLQVFDDVPHTPLTISISLQATVAPPLTPLQDQLHGPLPPTAEALPLLHKPVVGALDAAAPEAAPHEPLTGALQAIVSVLFVLFVQFQVHGPLPETAEAISPLGHRLVIGALVTPAPFAEPQVAGGGADPV